MSETTRTELNLSIATTCEVNLGDHGERHTTAHEYIKGETVEDLVLRVFDKLNSPWTQHNPTDKITLKVVVGKDGLVTGQARREAPTPAVTEF